jgi:16S rRNA (cytosine1402-N4)-methyltransferase
MMQVQYHIPVMPEEVTNHLNLKKGMTVVDATIGTAGHALRILEKITPGGLLIGIDKDKEALEITQERLKNYKECFQLIHGDFRYVDSLLAQIGIYKVDGILFDLGVSLHQLSNPERGFSFQQNGPLDMRLDRESFVCAYDLVNNLNADEISNLLWTFGQEKNHNRIARLLVKERQKKPIQTTQQLAQLVAKVVGFYQRRIHPATRTFQALRIAVNRELESLSEGIDKAVELLNPQARIVVISFHSLEDRIVKHKFKEFALKNKLKIVTKKPLRPTKQEVINNPSSRSAKMRVAERV